VCAQGTAPAAVLSVSIKTKTAAEATAGQPEAACKQNNTSATMLGRWLIKSVLEPQATARIAVDKLVESMRTSGSLQPIVLRPQKGTGYYLIAGHCRLEAARQLKWESIPAVIIDGLSADRALMAEIDENLIRGELSAVERAVHIRARKELYEKLYPRSKHGGARGAGRGRGKAKPSKEPKSGSFQTAMTKATRRGKSSIKGDSTRAKEIPGIDQLAGTSLDQGDELDALAKPPPEQQADLIARALAGEQLSAKGAAKKHQRDTKMTKLVDASKQASEKLGTKFYDVIYADLPWQYETWSETGMDRSADNHYPTMTMEQLCAMQLPAADNCVLFLWATQPILPCCEFAIRYSQVPGVRANPLGPLPGAVGPWSAPARVGLPRESSPISLTGR
jgi:hypothetical protein